MKPDHLTWHEYLRGYGSLRWRRPGDEQRFHETLGLLQPLYALRGGDLLKSTGAKNVIAEPTTEFIQRAKKAPPFSFRVQCPVTGRVSRFIEYERLIEFGILTEDTKTGGNFPVGRQEVTDRVAPIVARLQSQLEQFRPVWDDPSVTPWHVRYAEYLQSEQWLTLRERVLERDGHRCTVTGKTKAPGDPLQVHHLTYERVGCERLEDLVTVCRSQHEKIHNRRFVTHDAVKE